MRVENGQLFVMRGYTAPETRAAAERAALLCSVKRPEDFKGEH
jgi:hypothetical protein